MSNAEDQRKCAAKKRAEGLTKWCEWSPVERVTLLKQVVKYYSECDLGDLAAEVTRLGKGKR